MLSVMVGVFLGIVLVFALVEFAALVGHLGRIADALAAQNRHYGIPAQPPLLPTDPAYHVPPEEPS